MNAIDFLLKEHEKVRAVFSDITDESKRMETKKKLFSELSNDLTRHEIMEETVWYPKLIAEDNLQEIIEHLIKEEKAASESIEEIKQTDNDDEWLKAVIKLKKDVEHHAHEEETKLFPKVEKLLETKELEEIGKEMYEYKQSHKK